MREELFRAEWKYFIAEYEHDTHYRFLFDWLLEEIAKSDWKPRPYGQPDTYWREFNRDTQSHNGG